MKVEWGTVVATLVGFLLITVVIGLLTTKKVDVSTGVIKTKFTGFEGDKKDNMNGNEE